MFGCPPYLLKPYLARLMLCGTSQKPQVLADARPNVERKLDTFDFSPWRWQFAGPLILLTVWLCSFEKATIIPREYAGTFGLMSSSLRGDFIRAKTPKALNVISVEKIGHDKIYFLLWLYLRDY